VPSKSTIQLKASIETTGRLSEANKKLEGTIRHLGNNLCRLDTRVGAVMACLQSVVIYGLEAFHNTAQTARINSFKCTALKKSIGLPTSTRNSSILWETGEIEATHEITIRRLKLVKKIMETNDIHKKILELNVSLNTDWWKSVKEDAEEVGINIEELKDANLKLVLEDFKNRKRSEIVQDTDEREVYEVYTFGKKGKHRNEMNSFMTEAVIIEVKLRCRRSRLNGHRFRMGHSTPFCPFCLSWETTDHFLEECEFYHEERKELVDELGETNITELLHRKEDEHKDLIFKKFLEKAYQKRLTIGDEDTLETKFSRNEDTRNRELLVYRRC